MTVAVPAGYVPLGARVDIDLANTSPVYTETLAAGQSYFLVATGQGICNVASSRPADAEYQKYQNGRTPQDKASDGTDMGIKATNPNVNLRWGAYRTQHEYGLAFTGGGAKLGLYFADSLHIDNAGTISVQVYALPAVSVVATDAEASEDGRDPAVFTISRTGPSSAGSLDVFFTLGTGSTGEATPSTSATGYPDGIALDGKDYTVGGATHVADNVWKATISSGNSVPVTARPLNDAVREADENIDITLIADRSSGGTLYANPATNPATQPKRATAILAGMVTTLTLPSDPFAGEADAQAKQQLTALEEGLGSGAPAERATAATSLDTLLADKPALVPVAEQRANELQTAGGGDVNLIAGLRTGAGNAKARQQPLRYAFNADTSVLTIHTTPLTDQLAAYDTASITIDEPGVLVRIQPAASAIVFAGDSREFRLVPLRSGNGLFIVKVKYKKIVGDVVVSDLPEQTLEITVNKLWTA